VCTVCTKQNPGPWHTCWLVGCDIIVKISRLWFDLSRSSAVRVLWVCTGGQHRGLWLPQYRRQEITEVADNEHQVLMRAPGVSEQLARPETLGHFTGKYQSFPSMQFLNTIQHLCTR
jgi:hypothetical protein